MSEGLMTLQEVLGYCQISKRKFYELNKLIPLKRVPNMRRLLSRQEWVDEWLDLLALEWAKECNQESL